MKFRVEIIFALKHLKLILINMKFVFKEITFCVHIINSSCTKIWKCIYLYCSVLPYFLYINLFLTKDFRYYAFQYSTKLHTKFVTGVN